LLVDADMGKRDGFSWRGIPLRLAVDAFYEQGQVIFEATSTQRSIIFLTLITVLKRGA
jgi:hypothetical protein